MKKLHKILPWLIISAFMLLSDLDWRQSAAIVILCLALYALVLMIVASVSSLSDERGD